MNKINKDERFLFLKNFENFYLHKVSIKIFINGLECKVDSFISLKSKFCKIIRKIFIYQFIM